MATFVLIHGAWEGGGVWRPVARRLRAAGHEVHAPSLTGLGDRKHLSSSEVGLGVHIQDALGLIDEEELSDIVLVGHSYGGMVIAGVADRAPEKIASLVYLDAFVPEDGQSIRSLLPSDVALPTASGADWRISPPAPPFFGLKQPETIAYWESRTSPHPAACFSEPVRLTGGIGRIEKKTFIHATNPPRRIYASFYEKLRNRSDWIVRALPCSHFIPLEMPDELTALLLEATPAEAANRAGRRFVSSQ